MSTLSTTNLKNASSASNNIVLGTDGSVTVGTITGTSVRGVVTSGTAVASTSGTSIDFTSIPSWVKRVTVMFRAVSTSGTSQILIRLGAGSIQTSGYIGSGASLNDAGTAASNKTNGFGVDDAANAAGVRSGSCTFILMDTDMWVYQGAFGRSDIPSIGFGAGAVTLSGALDRIRITTVNGTDTFDGGTINILYEG